jgi:hypothetical protein
MLCGLFVSTRLSLVTTAADALRSVASTSNGPAARDRILAGFVSVSFCDEIVSVMDA